MWQGQLDLTDQRDGKPPQDHTGLQFLLANVLIISLEVLHAVFATGQASIPDRMLTSKVWTLPNKIQ